MMGTTTELFNTFNRAFLDVAPVAALLILVCLWIIKRRRFSAEEKKIRRRLEGYRQLMPGESNAPAGSGTSGEDPFPEGSTGAEGENSTEG